MEQSGERIGPYEIRGRIGAGGMGVVHLCWDPRLKRKVAVKTLRPELGSEAQARHSFLREARAVAAISHPNVAQIFDIGEQDGVIFFAMEYLDGRSLQEVLRDERRLDPGRAVGMVRQAAMGLKAAADLGIVHRDVKPSNLMLLPDGTVKVMDFGLARETVADSSLISSTVLFGTPEYMAPERTRGQETDVRSDIYSLGITLYELVVGRPPFVGPDAASIIGKHVRESVPAPRKLRPDLPAALNFIILRMLSKRPGDRPQSYEVVIRQLERMPGVGGKTARQVTVPEARPASLFARAAPVLVSALAVAGLLGAWGQLTKSDPAGDRVPPVPTGQADPGPGIMRLAQRSAELTVVESVSEITPDGRLRIAGEVRNDGDGSAVHSRVRITLEDQSGQHLDSTEVSLSPPVVPPGESSGFEALFAPPSAKSMIRLELSWLS